MKLGDSMAPIEACNVWSDVCPRKTRPPKIGDIPRHVAVDEESPGCSSSRSLGQFNEIKSAKSMLERSTSCQIEHGRPGALPVIEDFIKLTVSSRNNEGKILRNSDKFDTKLTEKTEVSYKSDSRVSNETDSNGCVKIFTESSESLDAKDSLMILQKSASLRVPDCTDAREEEVSSEEDIPERIYEVRKDSALYIGETNIDSLSLRDSLLAVGAESRPVGTIEPCNSREKIEDPGNLRFSGRRARRESSGYFSNLGTFDEDRWIASANDLVNQQDIIATREAYRERRRSSTKNRLPVIYNQQQSTQSTFGLLCGQQSPKIPNLVCPANKTDGISELSSASDVATVTKMSRVEMPNITEQASLELEKSVNFEAIDNSEITTFPSEIDDRLADKTSEISLENVPTKNDNVSAKNGSRNDKVLRDIIVENESKEMEDQTKKLSNNLDTSNQLSPRSGNRQRRLMVVHQCSSSNKTSTELERIIEKPYSETVNRKSIESPLEIDKNSALRTSESKEALTDEDDNDAVVTAKLEPQDERNVATDSKETLPRSIKVYQLLSTQSEDRGDVDANVFDRRISLQISRNHETVRENSKISTLKEQPNYAAFADEKKLIHADSVPILKIPSSSSLADVKNDFQHNPIVETNMPETSRVLSSSDDSSLCSNEKMSVDEKSSNSMIAATRPIYPYCPYSPYASPQGSPRTNRRRPLRESRRVSIDSRQGALQLNQYKLLNNIGQGSYGIVKLAYNEEDDTHYAMKILSKKKLMKKAGIFGRIAPGRKGASNPLAKVYREIALLKKLDHPNVVKLVEVLDDPDEDNLYLVFELVQKGEVLQLPTDTPLDETTARRHFRDVVMGVEYLHYQRIVHRDIKPSNLLVDSEGRVKVADLGVSAELRAAGELLTGSAGTPAFAAPETTTPGAQYSGTLCDVWSMGVTLYSLVTGRVPWDGAGSIIGVQAAVRSEQLRFPEKPCLSESLRNLISRMLAKDPNKRISLVEIKEHSWVTNDGREPLPNEADNCRLPVTVTDEEVARVVTRVPKLDTLILIKTMLKQHSFQNPFLPRRIVRLTSDVASGGSIQQQSSYASNNPADSSKDSKFNSETSISKTEQFHNAGRSNSAPDSYEWQTNGRQISSDSLLPPVTESSIQEIEIEKR